MDLKELFRHHETVLEGKLSEIRSKFNHQGIKGNALECAFRELLTRYLPKRLSVGTGQVIDSDAQISQQTDVLIATEYHPGILDPNEPDLYFLEGICGAGEVKTKLSGEHLEAAIKNCKSFKRLNRKPVESVFMGKGDRRLTAPYFIFAMESAISVERIVETLDGIEPPGEIDMKLGPDIVFVKGKGMLVDPRGSQNIGIKSDDGIDLRQWAIVKKAEVTLFDFFMLLLTIMPIEVHMRNFMRLYSDIKR